jgi:predicted acylesterase/phospholipase RssA
MLDDTYKCNNIDTIIFSGGGKHGIAYLPIYKYLKDNNIIDNITKYYGVSAGSITALAFNIGLKYEEAYDIFFNKINFKDLMRFEVKSLLTITKTLGLNDGSKLENVIKYMLELKGFNPYITLLDLYNLTNKELYIGATALIKREFTLFNYKSHPDLPVWVAVRMSCSIPILFTPLQYYEINDLYIDGGLLNNNPINYVINELIDNHNNDVDVNTDNNDNDVSSNKYNFNFICITLNAFDYNIENINNISFFKYLSLVIKTLFINQSHSKDKYKQYIINIPTYKYKLLDDMKVELDKDYIDNMFNDIYNIFSNQFEDKIKNKCLIINENNHDSNSDNGSNSDNDIELETNDLVHTE